MNTKIPVEGQPGLYRDENTGAILNCSDVQYQKYIELKQVKLKEIERMNELKNKVDEIDHIKNDIGEIKNIMNVILQKLNLHS
jgi:hypothetical protein